MIDPTFGFRMDKEIASLDLSSTGLISPSIRLLIDSILANFILADSILIDGGVGGWESGADLAGRLRYTLLVGSSRYGRSDLLSLGVGRRLGWSA